MKRPLVLTTCAVAGLVALGLRQGRELDALHAERKAVLGSDTVFEVADEYRRPTRRPRPDRNAEARRIAADFVAYAVEMHALGYKATENPEGELRQRIISQMNAVTSLDGRQLRILVDEIVRSPAMSDSLKGMLMRWALPDLIRARPADALDVMTPEVRRLIRLNTSGGPPGLLREALARLSDDDPEAAIVWFLENRGELEPDLHDSAVWGLLGSHAERDLAGALRLGDELGLAREDMVPSLVRACSEAPAQRLPAVKLLREWRREAPEERLDRFNYALGDLVFGTVKGSKAFEEVARRVEQLELSADEMELVVFPFVAQSTYRLRPSEAAQWAGWLTGGAPHPAGEDRIRTFYQLWASEDHRAAEAWLDEAADGPAKHICILAFAEVMGPYEPARVVRWLESLPPGPQREEALTRLMERGSQ